MLGVNVVCVGKLKEQYWRDACAEYIKRLGAYCRLSVIELSESRLPQKPSDAEINAALLAEGKLMDAYLSQKGAFNIALCVEAEQMTSEELSKRIDAISVSGFGSVNIFIGSSFGLDRRVKSACDLRLGMSKLTLPHQLARVVILEQLYRAFGISAGSKYHK